MRSWSTVVGSGTMVVRSRTMVMGRVVGSGTKRVGVGTRTVEKRIISSMRNAVTHYNTLISVEYLDKSV